MPTSDFTQFATMDQEQYYNFPAVPNYSSYPPQLANGNRRDMQQWHTQRGNIPGNGSHSTLVQSTSMNESSIAVRQWQRTRSQGDCATLAPNPELSGQTKWEFSHGEPVTDQNSLRNEGLAGESMTNWALTDPTALPHSGGTIDWPNISPDRYYSPSTLTEQSESDSSFTFSTDFEQMSPATSGFECEATSYSKLEKTSSPKESVPQGGPKLIPYKHGTPGQTYLNTQGGGIWDAQAHFHEQVQHTHGLALSETDSPFLDSVWGNGAFQPGVFTPHLVSSAIPISPISPIPSSQEPYQFGVTPLDNVDQMCTTLDSYAVPSNALPLRMSVEEPRIAPTIETEPTRAVSARRNIEDKLLLEGKREGLTYKEIKRRIGTEVAESTLRGRYRSLTKARKDRLRKPVWKHFDIQLLHQIVEKELDRLDSSCRSLSRSQKLGKVSWKRVSEYIATHGGSYRFGNSTCKKKWNEIDDQR
ncbi:hypothetical protein GQ43DRAFT_479506 [Delitschia confertaspora ATCC 74209]|uniref:Myb-like domain-containing protein n=1 Tax=Delitschia confertaspora ATCC 74209 TaxID=1513339 RepID=A0A9P4JR77_9PLEO|nr:hypothetical protein GQ43DRAFT_479506 [Delitschia confertaspora ATCC 74209]